MRVRVGSTVIRSQKHAPAIATREASPNSSTRTHATSARPHPRHDGRGSRAVTERPESFPSPKAILHNPEARQRWRNLLHNYREVLAVIERMGIRCK